jgi:hypothetical protein
MILARELGELFGVHSHESDTVQSYLERVHAAIGLGASVGATRRRAAEAPPESETDDEEASDELRERTRAPRPLELPRGP